MKEFQFLIGNLITEVSIYNLSAEAEKFQFLIGNLITDLISQKQEYHLSVSIPYR